jgi:hypothetical protein
MAAFDSGQSSGPPLSLRGGSQVIVLLEKPGYGTYACTPLAGVPVLKPALIVIAAAGSPASNVLAQTLFDALVSEILAFSVSAVRTITGCPGEIDEPARCHAMKSDCDKVLVFVSDGVASEAWRDAFEPWRDLGPGDSVLPILPDTARTAFTRVIPQEFHSANAAYWKRSIGEVVPAVLAAAGITSQNPRIFISYRQAEAAAFAVQLFDALSHENFDVFLDYFRTPRGINFQSRLTQELGNKSMVVVIESAGILDSPWTTYEINVAKTCSLGIVALRLPSGTRVPGIDDDDRISFELADFTGRRADAADTLLQQPLDRTLQRIRRDHDRSFVRRRAMLRESMRLALSAEGISDVRFERGSLHVGNGPEYIVWLTPRPPELLDFYSTHKGCSSTTKGVIIGLSQLMEPSTFNTLDWLATVSNIVLVDEGQLKNAAAEIARRTL